MSLVNVRPDFIAILKYKKTEDGGRTTPAHLGYRPHIKFPFSDMRTSGQQIFSNKEIVYPGETVEAEIMILAVDFFQNSLTEGLEFEFGEGARIVASGTILKILNEKLKVV